MTGNSSAKRERRLRRGLRRLLMAVAVLIVFVATLSGLSRALLPWIERYQPNFEAMVSEQLDVPVRFGSLDLRWQGYQPQLILRDVHLDAGPRADSLSVGLSWWRSLAERRLVADKITVDALRFTLIRGDDGWSVADLSLSLRPGDVGQQVSWSQVEDQIARLGHLSLRDAVVEFRDPTGHRDRLTFSLAAELDRSHWRGSGTARLDSVSDEPMHFAGEGEFGERSEVSLFMQVDGWRLPAVQRSLDRYGGPAVQGALGGCPGDGDPLRCEVGLPWVDSGRLDGRLWLNWHDRQLVGLTLQADVQELAVTRESLFDEKSQQAALSRVSTTLAWGRDPDGWHLAAEDVHIRPTHGPALPTKFVRLRSRGGEMRFATDHADLGQLSVWLAAAPLPKDFLDLLDQNVPRGQAQDVRLRFDHAQLVEGFLELRDFGNTSGVPLRPVVGTRSGRGGMDLTLYKQPGGWLAQIDQQDLILAIPGMFREPVPIDRIQGQLYWFDRQGLALYSPDLKLVSGGLDLAGRFYYRQADEDRPGYLGVDTEFALNDTRAAPAYLPRHLIGSSILAWLDQALEGEDAAGHIYGGNFVFHGDPARAPFTDGGGYFSVVFDFRGVTLPYKEDWPPLTNADGHMAFINKQYHVDVARGRLGHLDVTNARVSIFELDRPRLEIAVDQRAGINDLLATLGQTPLVGSSAVGGLSGSGDGPFALDIRIGLTPGTPPPTASGSYQFDGNQVSIAGGRFLLDGLVGTLRFTDARFSADDLSGRFLDRPFRAQVTPRDSDRATRIQAQTSLTPEGLQAVLGEAGRSPVATGLLDSVDGVTDVDVRMDVSHSEGNVEVRAESALTGWRSRLPPPFDKPASMAWPLQVDLSVSHGRLGALSARLQGTETWRAELAFDESGQLARSWLGNRDEATASPAEPPDNAHRVSLSLPQLPAGSWLDWWDSIGATTTSSDDVDQGLLSALWIDAELGRLSLGGWWLDEVKLDLSPRADGWWLDVSGEENQGALHLVTAGGSNPGQLQGTFQQLKLHHASDENTSEVSPPTAWSLSALPEAKFSIETLSVNDMVLGRLAASAHPEARIYHLDQIEWQPVPELSVSGSGRVQDGVGDGPQGQQTRLSLMVSGTDLGKALTVLNAQSPIYGGQIEQGDFSISWPGSPTSFAVGRAAGNGQFVLNDGQIKGIDPGAGRLVGLMSLGALADRLRLDFRDVTGEGLYYESLAGQWHLDRGRLDIDTLELINPSLSILIDGEVQLMERLLDLRARVYADFGMLLPLIGTVAGGPLIGGAVLALQEAFKKLDQTPEPSMTYHIGGSFDQPEVVREKAPTPVPGWEDDAP